MLKVYQKKILVSWNSHHKIRRNIFARQPFYDAFAAYTEEDIKDIQWYFSKDYYTKVATEYISVVQNQLQDWLERKKPSSMTSYASVKALEESYAWAKSMEGSLDSKLSIGTTEEDKKLPAKPTPIELSSPDVLDPVI